VLIRVHAAGVNNEWHPRAGFPGVPEQRRPKIHLPWIPGSDVSGVVEAVGSDVTTFHQGDAVYGLIRFPASVLAGLGTYGGTYAEYTTANASDLAPKPTTIDHFQAAAVPAFGAYGLAGAF
jgi:NADPH:quinone reductase-like Zn-dependent oxidoreductase